MLSNYLKYYDLEKYVFNEVHKNFHKNGSLTVAELFCIIIWKANRSKTKTAERLILLGSKLEECIKKMKSKAFSSVYQKEKLRALYLEVCIKTMTSKVYSAIEPKEKMRILKDDFKFGLPMASAILTVLYPSIFTVYDVRVCDTFEEYKDLINKINYENIWVGYQKYLKAVENSMSGKFSLREKDKALWGKSFFEQLQKDEKEGFPKRGKE